MLVSVYIRKADEDKWRKLPKKTEAIHAMLNGQRLSALRIEETVPKGVPINATQLLNDNPKAVRSLAVEEEYDPYKNLIYDTKMGAVADTELEDYLEESTPEMVKELKRRGQVR